MSNLVFISGDFCSGSTLLFTLFRKTREYYCLYEPLHSLLREYLIWPLRLYEHHFFVEEYFSEYRGFGRIRDLFNPHWADTALYMTAEEDADDLYRYLSYLIGTAFGRQSKVLLKCNRVTFRLPWLRSKFPHAKVVHVYREKKSEWNSIVTRVQQHLGREDVGQEDVRFNGFSIATWCEDLKGTFPELDSKNSRTGYERFCKLWDLSFAAHQPYADISIDFSELTHSFEKTCERLWKAVGCTSDFGSLKRYVVPPEEQKKARIRRTGLTDQVLSLIDRAGRKYAKLRVQADSYLRERRAAWTRRLEKRT